MNPLIPPVRRAREEARYGTGADGGAASDMPNPSLPLNTRDLRLSWRRQPGRMTLFDAPAGKSGRPAAKAAPKHERPDRRAVGPSRYLSVAARGRRQSSDLASSMWTPLLPSTICVTRRFPASEHSM